MNHETEWISKLSTTSPPCHAFRKHVAKRDLQRPCRYTNRSATSIVAMPTFQRHDRQRYFQRSCRRMYAALPRTPYCFFSDLDAPLNVCHAFSEFVARRALQRLCCYTNARHRVIASIPSAARAPARFQRSCRYMYYAAPRTFVCLFKDLAAMPCFSELVARRDLQRSCR